MNISLNMDKRFFLIILIIVILILQGCSSNFQDIKMDNDTSLYASHNGVCENPYIKVKCQKGLVCREITTKPYFLKVCLYPNESIPEDFTYRYSYNNKEFVEHSLRNISKNSSS